MEEYVSNSYKSKESSSLDKSNDKEPIEKVTAGKVRIRKKNGVQRFADSLFADDRKELKNYIIIDVLIPAIKKTIVDMVTTGINLIFYGETGKKNGGASTKVSYRSYYDGDSPRVRDRDRLRAGYEYDDIILDSRSEAEEVLTRMDELIERYGMVSVADFYDLVGVTGNHTDNKYGWTDIRNSSIVRIREGYLIKMPRTIPL